MSDSSLFVVVSRKTVEAMGVNAYELVGEDGAPLPAYEAGAHIDVFLPNGLIRQYSLCGSARDGRIYRIAVLRDSLSRGGSKAIHDGIDVGDSLRIGRPRNLFPLHAGGHKILLLAGGIGITPLLAMAYERWERKEPFELHYFARSADRAAFLSELSTSQFKDHVSFHFDDAHGDGVDAIQRLLGEEPCITRLYSCGPPGFLSHVLETAGRLGWPPGQVHSESFTPLQPEGESVFEVRIPSLGRSVRVEANETVVAAILRLGVQIPVSCEQGICGTCLTRVLDGEPEHRDMYLTDEERAGNQQFIPCCSRALSPVLVLDL